MLKPNILIADDHPLLLRGLEEFLKERKYNIINTHSDGLSAYNAIIKDKPDIAILDIEMPNLTGVDIAKNCKRYQIDTKIILITLHKEKKFFEDAVKYNIHGYLLKEFALTEIEACIASVSRGEPYFSEKIYKRFTNVSERNSDIEKLTPSEVKILKRIAEEMTSTEIADLLSISVRTVEKHRANIIRKLTLEQKPNALLIWSQKNKQLLL
ncbi:DNA-binding NarL/FixJ family response regulator [Aquimarina sp. EL_43]|uniref:response regulator n=1 Tax=unclassified Aquimarina TaxID=2627091 RepID=UPI000D6DE1F3|nr:MULTISPECIES: response regulator transcription factor [unclassified Aquimarina]MBG6128742.1 DNA-binding NarL/FixJ family response regulator [Aquimarina sp. EL_35]MBG6149805.1 DNA-binding NarL/FixJ family response regulator [Aquimarina sp. EL_32]MBG6167508.1 DNA-binding NarL/FixJ family response regulator [Aquimarina sp. EL_43]